MTATSESVVDTFWKSLAFHEQMYVLESDPMFRYFDRATVQGIIDGKPSNFTLDKIVELQDRLAALVPRTPEADEIEGILTTSKARPVRSHKLVKAIRDRCEFLHNNRDTALQYLVNAPAASATDDDSYPEKPNNTTPERLATKAAQPTATSETPSTTQAPARFQFPMAFCLSANLPPQAKINVRSSPVSGTEDNVVGTIAMGDSVVAVDETDEWLKVTWPSGSNTESTAWVLRDAHGVELLVPTSEHPNAPATSSVQAPASPPVVPTQEILATEKVASSRGSDTLNEPTSADTVATPAPLPQQTVTQSDIQHQEVTSKSASQVSNDPQPSTQAPRQDFRLPVPAVQQRNNTVFGSSGEYVSIEEHRALEAKVAKLESELFRVMALLRSV